MADRSFCKTYGVVRGNGCYDRKRTAASSISSGINARDAAHLSGDLVADWPTPRPETDPSYKAAD